MAFCPIGKLKGFLDLPKNKYFLPRTFKSPMLLSPLVTLSRQTPDSLAALRHAHS